MHSWQDVDISGYDEEILDSVFGDNPSVASAVPGNAPGGNAPGGNAPGVTALARVLKSAQEKNIAPPDFDIFSEDEYDGVVRDDADDIDVTVGALVCGADDPTAEFRAPSDAAFPLLGKMQSHFAANSPPPRQVRLDTEESYRDFRNEHAAPLCGALADKLTELQAAYADHVKDQHGHILDGDPDRIVRLERDVAALRKAVSEGGIKVPLSLEPSTAGKYKCWRSGPTDKQVICCSIRLRGPDGKPRIATTGARLDDHVEEAADHVRESGDDPGDVLGVLPKLAEVLGGGKLYSQLCAAAPALLARPEAAEGTFVGTMVSRAQPSLAAIMKLHQMCEKGDPAACAEMGKLSDLANKEGGEALRAALGEAGARLMAFRAAKTTVRGFLGGAR